MRNLQDILRLMHMCVGVSRWESCSLDNSFDVGGASQGSDMM